MKVRRIKWTADLRPGVYAKDVILHIIRQLGANGGIGLRLRIRRRRLRSHVAWKSA